MKRNHNKNFECLAIPAPRPRGARRFGAIVGGLALVLGSALGGGCASMPWSASPRGESAGAAPAGARESGTGASAGSATSGLLGLYLERQARDWEAIHHARVERQDDRLLVTFAGDLLFETGSSGLSPGALQRLERVAEILKRYPETDVVIKGYTDSVGSETQNLHLSEDRAGNVRNDLVAMGVAGQRITAIGFGEQFPVTRNETEADRQRNRRVEFELVPRQDQLTEGTGRY